MPWSPMWGISGRLNNTRQVPAPRAFVSDQTGLVEERRDGRDLSHLCCFASRTQQGSSSALTRHRLLHGGRPFRLVCTPLSFQRSYSGVGCECLREWSRSRGARETRPSTIVASTWASEGIGNTSRPAFEGGVLRGGWLTYMSTCSRLQPRRSRSPASRCSWDRARHSPTRGTYPSEWNFYNSRGGPLGG
jgi:hypothetical protein